jgi:hypothetical protein
MRVLGLSNNTEGNREQTRTDHDFDELKAGRRCVHMQAYALGNGQLRYDGVWQSGGDRGQSRAISWAFNDFVRRWGQEAAKGKRLVHMHLRPRRRPISLRRDLGGRHRHRTTCSGPYPRRVR